MPITFNQPTTLEEAREVIVQLQEAERNLEQNVEGLTSERTRLTAREIELQERNQALFLRLTTPNKEEDPKERKPVKLDELAEQIKGEF